MNLVLSSVLKSDNTVLVQKRVFATYFPTNVYFSALRYYLFEIILHFKSHCEVLRKNKLRMF